MERIITLLLTLAGILFLGGLIVMWCWNYVMPDLFNLPEITFWQSFVLMMLCTSLFKGGTTSVD